jgi:uncharacterized protein YqjF (DUF2071 family)
LVDFEITSCVGLIRVNDFNYAILKEVAHRPWPMPAIPWIMTQTWLDVLFAHWAIEPGLVRARVPAELELDLFEEQSWLGIVPFRMSNVAPRALPALPGMSAFPELNVRTYVRVGGKPGVFFFSLDATNPVAIGIAKLMFGLPYYAASMQVAPVNGCIRYSSRRTAPESPAAELVGSYHPTGEVFQASPGSLEYFLTERYCLYTVDDDRQTFSLDIHHPPWPLQPARASFDVLRMTEQVGLSLPSTAPVLHYAKRQDVVAFPMRRVAAFK